MASLDRRHFLAAGLMFLTPLVKAQTHITFQDVQKTATAASGNDITGLVHDVILVRPQDSEKSIQLLRDFVRNGLRPLSPETLTRGLINVVGEGSGDFIRGGDLSIVGNFDRDAPIEVARILIQAGANAKFAEKHREAGFNYTTNHIVFVDNYTLVHAAAARDLRLVKTLVEEGNADATAVAVWNSRRAKRRWLRWGKPILHQGNYVPTSGHGTITDLESPVDSAVKAQAGSNIIRYLGSKGAKSAEGKGVFCPAIIRASLNGNADALEALRDIGAPLDARDQEGHSAADYLTGRAETPQRYLHYIGVSPPGPAKKNRDTQNSQRPHRATAKPFEYKNRRTGTRDLKN